MYQLIKNIRTKEIASVLRTIDKANIPFDQANTDYQAYLKWVSEGNTPEQADNV